MIHFLKNITINFKSLLPWQTPGFNRKKEIEMKRKINYNITDAIDTHLFKGSFLSPKKRLTNEGCESHIESELKKFGLTFNRCIVRSGNCIIVAEYFNGDKKVATGYFQ